ncbi:NlpC/P60 family protein [Garciella nitratireducens]|nr:NlpC/P60 family protein [Garciella nitratireducens]
MKKQIQKTKEYLKGLDNWKKTIAIFSIIVIITIIGFRTYQNSFSYQVTLNGKNLGIVREVHIAENALEAVKKEIAKEYGKEAHFKSSLTFKKVRVPQEKLFDQEKVEEGIFQNIEVYKPAAVIVVNGKDQISLNSIKEAEEILDKMKEPYKIKQEKNSNTKLVAISFQQEVEVVSKDVLVENILSKEQGMKKLSQNSQQTKNYQVAQGDSAWDISRSFHMGIRTLEEANPGKDIEQLKPGETIHLSIEKPLLDVVTIIEKIDKKELDFKVKEKEDSSLYIGESKVEQEGKKGEKEITKKVVLVNGTPKKEEILQEVITIDPQDKIIKKGIKQRSIVRQSTPMRQSTPTRMSRSATTSRNSIPTYNGSVGSSIVATAKQYIGVPYQSGGASPSGFDCSGFTKYVYGQYGISLPRTSSGQASAGGYVSYSNLKPGDLVVFSGHVGIYIGGNSFIHSPSPGKSIRIDSLNNSYWAPRFICGRRVY